MLQLSSKFFITNFCFALALSNLTFASTFKEHFNKNLYSNLSLQQIVAPEKLRMEYFSNRRSKLVEQLEENSIVIIPSNSEMYRNGDNDFNFRQDSNFYYLSGFDEPSSVLVIIKNNYDSKFVLFVRPSNTNEEQWQGKRAGLEGAKYQYLADESYDIKDLDTVIVKLIQGKSIIYYDYNIHSGYNARLNKWLNEVGHPLKLASVANILTPMRLIKDEYEKYLITRASNISASAHNRIFRSAKHATHEYELEADFVYETTRYGAKLSYLPIIGSGVNSCILHYNSNDNAIDKNGLILVDAGAEYINYAADVTRTLPASGRFSPEQRAIYKIVLKAQLAAIEKAVPGGTLRDLNTIATRIITQGLVDLGIIQSYGKSIDELVAQGAYVPFYMHGVGHWVGLDVHDVGTNDQVFKPGMVITVEPGIYIKDDLIGIDPKWLNIGVRIEDTVLITEDGNDVLSKDAPKSIEDIELLMNSV